MGSCNREVSQNSIYRPQGAARLLEYVATNGFTVFEEFAKHLSIPPGDHNTFSVALSYRLYSYSMGILAREKHLVKKGRLLLHYALQNYRFEERGAVMVRLLLSKSCSPHLKSTPGLPGSIY